MKDFTPTGEPVNELIAAGNNAALTKFFNALSPSETARSTSRLTEEERLCLLSALSPQDAVDVIEDIPEAQAADEVKRMLPP